MQMLPAMLERSPEQACHFVLAISCKLVGRRKLVCVVSQGQEERTVSEKEELVRNRRRQIQS